MSRVYQAWTPEEDQHLRDHWHRADLTTAQIGKMIGRGVESVKTRGRLNLKLGSRPIHDPWPPGLFEEVAALYAKGLGGSELARRFNLSRNQIVAKLSRRGLLRAPAPPVLMAPRAPKPPRRVTADAPPRAPKPKAQATGGRSHANPVELKVATAQANAEARERPADILKMARAFVPLMGCAPVPFGSKGCKWPVGGEGADMLQCGVQRAGERPYCVDHCGAAYTKPAPGKPQTASQYARSLRRWAA